MANELRKKSLYFDTGDPSTYNVATEFKLGELGEVVRINDKTWQKVQLDSGATSATATGVVAAGQLAFWKNKANKLVTNDSTQALGANAVGAANSSFRNSVAGVFTTAVTAGNYCAIQLRGQCNVKAASGGTYVVDDSIVANTGTAADVTTVAAGTAPTVAILGVITGPRSAPNAPVQLTLPDIQ